MPQRHIRPDAAAATQPATATRTKLNPTETDLKAATSTSSISGLFGNTSHAESAGKRRRQGSDEYHNEEDEDDDDEGESDASLPRKKLKTVDKNVLEAVNLDDLQDLDRIKSYLKDALCYINKLGAASGRCLPFFVVYVIVVRADRP